MLLPYNTLKQSEYNLPLRHINKSMTLTSVIKWILVGWLVLGLTALWDSISVYIGPSPKEREKEEGKDRRE